MGKHVIVGAGQVGSLLAEHLAGEGHDVTIVSRSGSGPSTPDVRRVAADVSDQDRLVEITRGADALFNCVNPKYHRWPLDWPPMASSMLAAAEANGSVLVITGNLYGYGPINGPITEAHALATTGTKGKVRVAMWNDALAAHDAGRARVVEVRASDYYGPGCRDQSHYGDRFVGRLLAGKVAQWVGPTDLPHSATYVPDVVRALATAATDERAWGQAWNVPTAPALTAKQFAEKVVAVAGTGRARVRSTPHWLLRAAGLFSPSLRELEETRYQFVRPYQLDSSAFESTFRVSPTPIEIGLAETIAWWRRSVA